MRMRPAGTGATLALLLQALATGCGGTPPVSEPLPFQNPDLPIDARVDDLVGPPSSRRPSASPPPGTPA